MRLAADRRADDQGAAARHLLDAALFVAAQPGVAKDEADEVLISIEKLGEELLRERQVD